MNTILKKIFDFASTSLAVYCFVALIAIVTGSILWTEYKNSQHPPEAAQEDTVQAEFTRNNTIIEHYLPHESSRFSIDYERQAPGDTSPVSIRIYADSPQDRYSAVQYLIQKDQEVTVRHPFIFVNYKSPLDE